MKNSCYLSEKEDCELTEVTVNGETFYVDEEIADEFSLKKLKQKILEKKEKKDEKEQEKKQAFETITKACESLGIDKEALAKLLLGKQDEPANQPASQPASQPAKTKQNNEDDFIEVDGVLKSSIRANVNSEEGVSAAMPAYTIVKDNDGKSIVEEGKKIKKTDDALITKSSMGTTVIRIDHRNGNEIDKMLKQVDEDYNLTRASVSGRGYMSGRRTIDCPLCGGSGISKVNNSKCPKCDGVGSIFV